ncbi:hypothetical protein [Jiangella gansuensis]|uniref:hypothetical protein n=1 Tax=Jiangella gansuensis TaxID=281473 RepID=UPI0012F988CA|nr:hypothetical protein [Jiangella gansuensis]
MTGRSSTQHESTGSGVARLVGHGIWMLIPVLSLSFLAFLPAVQAWWRARTAGWLITALILTASCAVIVTGMARDAGGAGYGALIIGTGLGGLVAAAIARPVVFDRRAEPELDPAVRAVLDGRERRRQAREILERDPAMAVELGIGRPDLRGGYDDGGLVDINHVGSDDLVAMLGWPRAAADGFVADRDRRRGYASLTEIAALSGLDPSLLDHGAERIVLLPYRPR